MLVLFQEDRPVPAGSTDLEHDSLIGRLPFDRGCKLGDRLNRGAANPPNQHAWPDAGFGRRPVLLDAINQNPLEISVGVLRHRLLIPHLQPELL